METGNHPPRTAFVLAGGGSRRMGRDKATLRWGRGTLLEHMLETLGRVATEVRVVGRGDLPDRCPGRGPVEGIRTALEASRTEDNLIVAVDLPRIPPTVLSRILAELRSGGTRLAVCEIAGRIPMCLGIGRELLPVVDDYLRRGHRSLEGLVGRIAHVTLTEADLEAYGLSPDAFVNLNTPDDYRAAWQETFG